MLGKSDAASCPKIHDFAPLWLISCGEQIDTNTLVLGHPIPWFPRHIRAYNCPPKCSPTSLHFAMGISTSCFTVLCRSSMP